MDITIDNDLDGQGAKSVVDAQGVYHTSKVTSNPTLVDGKYIVNVSAITSAQEALIGELIEEDKLVEASKVGLSFNIFAGGWVPAKGEIVKFTLGMVDTRDGGQDLRITSMAPLATAVTKKSSLRDRFANLRQEQPSAIEAGRPQPE